MRDFELERELERARNLISQSGRLIVLNSDRYNTALQRTVEEASFIDGPSVLTAAAEQVTTEQLTYYFSGRSDLRSPSARLTSAAAIFKAFGFGTIDFGKVSGFGGKVIVKDSHFARSWTFHVGKRDTPCCHFVSGFIAGAMSAAFQRPAGIFTAKERRCAVSGSKQCEFDVEVK